MEFHADVAVEDKGAVVCNLSLLVYGSRFLCLSCLVLQLGTLLSYAEVTQRHPKEAMKSWLL